MKDWEKIKLREVSKISYGYTDSASYQEVGPKFLRITDIQNNKVNWHDVPFCKIENSIVHKYLLKDGDIVFARTGATTGKSYLIKEPPPSIFASYLIRLQILDLKKLLPEFLVLFFQTNQYWQSIENGTSGSAQGGFNATKLGELELQIPNISEQNYIISVLQKTFESIEKSKENIEKNLKNAKELFESYLQSIFGNKGEHWEEKTLNEISENKDSKRIPITKGIRKSGNVPYYGASGIVDYVEGFIFDEDLLCISEDGANLLARTYPIAFSITGKTWVNNHAHVLKFDSIITQKLVEYYLNSINLADFISGMAQPKLNQAMLNKIPIPIPPLTMQKSIVDNFDKLQAQTKKLESIYQKKLESLEELKKSILQKAFSGELV